ncbi:MAG: serine/threonine protein kinase [Thermoanaerobaculia bacterium]|nr:serine/threonine protein kinase [Thermoanaerobaculia bacterium]
MIDDRYEILGELGRGGMSRVYRARDRLLDTEVAIKTLLTPLGSHGEDKSRLLREAQISLRITHPNVVRVYDAREFSNGIFLIMELLDGLGLDEIIRFDAPLPLAKAKRVLAEITAALVEAHQHNVVHRDLKPGNIIVLASGRTKVMDFGIARSYDTASQLTRAGEVIGSPMYMAPEQIQGLPLDGTCDLYALGVIAFAILTGREPFLGENANAVVLQHLNEPPPSILNFNPDVPPAWIAMVEKLLAKKPRDRYPSAEQLAQVISALPD